MADPEQGQFSRELDIPNTEPDQGDLAAEITTEEQIPDQLSEEEILQSEQEAEANQLAAIREEEAMSIQQLANQILQEGRSFGSPSVLKWGILFSLAVTNDVLDLLVLTGIGEIFSWVISLMITALILIIMWLMDSDMKKAQAYVVNVKDIAQQNQLASQARGIEDKVSGLAKGISERLAKIPGFKNIGLREKPRRNPLTRLLLGSALESIPFIGAINLITVWVFFAYRAEREAHRNAREAAEEAYNQMLTSAAEMV